MGREVRVYPSILSADFTKLGEDCLELREMGCTHLHVDVMDGQFVPPISFGEPVIRSLRKAVDLFFDVHYMGLHPEYGIDSIFEMKNHSLSILPELLDCDLYRFLKGDPVAANAYQGEYMVQFSWASETEARLDRLLE